MLAWESGAFTTHRDANKLAFEKLRGEPLGADVVFPTNTSWSQLANPWWKNQLPSHTGDWIYGPGMLPHVGDPLAEMTKLAQGAYNAQIDACLTAWGSGIIRVGQEMNLLGDLYKACTVRNHSVWVPGFRIWAGRAHAKGFLVAFNPNGGDGQKSDGTDTTYPVVQLLEEVKDVIDMAGPDYYDWWPANLTQATWDANMAKTCSVRWYLDWCLANHKHFCMPEWGLATQQVPPGGGDNPVFTANMTALFVEYAPKFKAAGLRLIECYYNEPFSNVTSWLVGSDNVVHNPKAAQAYVAGLHMVPAPAPAPVPVAAAYGLTYSTKGDRTTLIPLDGLSFPHSQASYIGLPEASGVNKVEFYLDGVLKHTESTPPWDYAGGSTTLANVAPAFTVGKHTMTAKAYYATTLPKLFTAAFTVT